MGRALLLPVSISDRGGLAGAECALIDKNGTHAVATCPFSGTRLVMARARPLSLDELLVKDTFYYRDQMGAPSTIASVPDSPIVPHFVGPGECRSSNSSSSPSFPSALKF
jgi:hypothetical protein